LLLKGFHSIARSTKLDANMNTMHLPKLTWQLQGWRPYVWQLRQSNETGDMLVPEIPPVPAEVPGSAQRALLNARIIENWNYGFSSRHCEWVEHLHWEFFTTVSLPVREPDQPLFLEADGLDYSGWVLLDSQTVSPFKGSLQRHRFDLTPFLKDQSGNVTLRIIFDCPPPEQGQVGFTSKSTFFKPRFSYSWDWCPRFVPTGIWENLRLKVGIDPLELINLKAELSDSLHDGIVKLRLKSNQAGVLRAKLQDGAICETREQTISFTGEQKIGFAFKKVAAWWPNQSGDQPLYRLELDYLLEGQVVWSYQQTLGFKKIVWKPCLNAPSGAEPWICEVNGKAIFLQGVNWTPVRMDYLGTTSAEYEQLIQLYVAMGCNILRVWGGAYLEKEDFYTACDKAGILVWQEFPLSSSGTDNYAPESPDVIADLCQIARDYIRRRQHHVSLLLWCGGNELQSSALGNKVGMGVPLDISHPCLAALNKVVEEEDSGIRFLPASSSGPRFCAEAKDYGKGLHHDVHGPWNVDGSWEQWADYWEKDDSLFRSEVGVPGTASEELILKYHSEELIWPPTKKNLLWLHANSWWIQWDKFQAQVEGLKPREALAHFVQLSQDQQAKALGIAAQKTKARFPSVGGFLIWMGHDAFPCLANTSIIDFDQNPKPAYQALKTVFASK
jgi:beta-mannosidase